MHMCHSPYHIINFGKKQIMLCQSKQQTKQRCNKGVMEYVTKKNDLGVVIDMGGKQAAHCQAATGKANRVLGCIRRGSNYKSK